MLDQIKLRTYHFPYKIIFSYSGCQAGAYEFNLGHTEPWGLPR